MKIRILNIPITQAMNVKLQT